MQQLLRQAAAAQGWPLEDPPGQAGHLAALALLPQAATEGGPPQQPLEPPQQQGQEQEKQLGQQGCGAPSLQASQG